MYVTTTDVYATAGIPNTVVPDATVQLLIKGAEAEVDRLTNTTYWSRELQATADAGSGALNLKDALAFGTNDYTDFLCWVFSGLGAGQIRTVQSNTNSVLTIDRAWTTIPDATSQYRLIYTGQSAYRVELRDASASDTIFTNYYPFVLLEAVNILSTNVSISKIYQYPDTGKLRLMASAEKTVWSTRKAQQNTITYFWGVYPIPALVKRYVTLSAALATLSTQAGGTYNIPSNYTMPEGSVTIGQATINIRATHELLSKEKESIAAILIKYISFADDPAQEGTVGAYAGSYNP